MDKEEILKRVKSDGPDEREQKINCDAYSFAGMIGCVICIAFIVGSLLKERNPFPYCLIAMAYCAADYLYKYAKLRRKKDLSLGIVALVAAVFWALLSVIKF